MLTMTETTAFNVVLFDGFETLDAFGPVEVMSKLPNVYAIEYYSLHGGIVAGGQNARVDTISFSEMRGSGILLLPGGMGTRALVNDESFIRQLKLLSEKSEYVLSVCTGAALLAKTGLLDGRRATTNKRMFEFVSSHGKNIMWDKAARWVREGKYYTSAGVAAGIDMTLGFIADTHGAGVAEDIARRIEYVWQENE